MGHSSSLLAIRRCNKIILLQTSFRCYEDVQYNCILHILFWHYLRRDIAANIKTSNNLKSLIPHWAWVYSYLSHHDCRTQLQVYINTYNYTLKKHIHTQRREREHPLTHFTHKTHKCTEKTTTQSPDGLFFAHFPALIKYHVSQWAITHRTYTHRHSLSLSLSFMSSRFNSTHFLTKPQFF